MKKEKLSAITLPALRGVMGTWVYYSSLMTLEQISKRVSYADEIHTNKKLSDMIQRRLKSSRSKEIAEYLNKQNERFFNSLVVATYGGEPNWHAVDSVSSKTGDFDITKLNEGVVEAVGFLAFRGDEKLFAVDGQHRLAGIKEAATNSKEDVKDDQVSIIFIGHKKTSQGLTRTRRLFTTLNKTAKPVQKNDIIALDEDDVMAITVRRLVEKSELFSDERIAFAPTNNMPNNNQKSLTTIGILYDCLVLLFSKASTDLKETKSKLICNRPDDERLEKYYKLANFYFQNLANSFPRLRTFFDAQDYSKIVKRYRGDFGGDALFRPKGLLIFTQVVVALTRKLSLKIAIKRVGKLPTSLTEKPFEGLLWESSTSTIQAGHDALLRDILIYMVGGLLSNQRRDNLLKEYRAALDDQSTQLPAKVI